ncbi:hypothetical protein BDY24DRAFT_2254 [Mrakia frigida]|uniref:uncharacterized protein n=1 Tax=Mrakia frigida TaxID=29902 RepID=UPI003FCBFD8D
MGRGESLRVNGQDWLNDLDSMSGPSPSRQGPNHSEPRPSGSTSHRQSQASSSRLSTSHGTTSAASKSTKPVSLDQQVEVTVSSSDSEDAPLKPPPPPKNATAGPSNPKRTSTGAGIIDRHKAKRHEVERPLPPPTRTKPSQEVLSISSDEEDDIQEFTTEEVATMHSTSGRQATIVGGQPGPSPAPSRRQPRPRSPSIPEAGPSQSKHPSPMDQYSVQTSRPPLPSFKKKEKAQLKGETDDDDAPAPAASTSTTGAVKRKVTDQPLPMRPVSGMMGGLTKKMKGKEGQMIVSPSGKPKSTSTSSTRKPPVARGEPGHKTFPVHEWWKGFSKQSSRTNLQIGGGMFKIGAGKNDGELSLPFPQILRMRASSQEPFLVSLELSDDGDRDKIISPAQCTQAFLPPCDSFR